MAGGYYDNILQTAFLYVIVMSSFHLFTDACLKFFINIVGAAYLFESFI